MATAGLGGMESFRIWVGQESEHCLLIGREVLSSCDDRIFADCEAFNRALLAKILGVAIAVENVDEVVPLSGRRRDSDIAVKKAWQCFDSFKVVFGVLFVIEGLGRFD